MEQGHGKNKLPEISKQLPRPLSPDNDIKMRVNANLRIEPSKEEMKTIEKQIKHDAHDHQIELLRQERKRVAQLEAELQEMKILAEAKEKGLEDELSEAMMIIVQREAQVEALKAENDRLLKGKRVSDKVEDDLVDNNARGVRAILRKEKMLDEAAEHAQQQREYHRAEKATLLKRINVLKELRQSLVPGLNDIDSTYWNFGVSIRGIATARVYDPAISDHGAIKLLIHICESHPTADVVLSAADALAELSANQKYRKIISHMGAIKPLCNRLSNALESVTSGNADLTQLSMFGLVAFALSRLAIDDIIRQEIASRGGIFPMVQLAKHSRNMILMHATCLALANLSYKNAANKSRICSEGGIEALTRVLKQEREDSVLCEAAKCVANVTCNNIRGQQAAGSGGAVQALTMLAARKELSATTVKSVMAAIGNIALNEPVGKPTITACVGIPPCVRYISKRRAALPVVINAMRAVGNIGYGSQSMKARVMSDKVGPPLCARLTACCTGIHTSLELLTEVCRTISSLCMNRDNARVFCSFGVIPPLVNLIKNTPELARKTKLGMDQDHDATNHHHKDSIENIKSPGFQAIECELMLLSVLLMNDEVRDVTVERHGGIEALLIGVNAWGFLNHNEPILNKISYYFNENNMTRNENGEEEQRLNHWKRVLTEEKYPRWMKIALMRIAPEILVDGDALYYLLEEVRAEGELYMKSAVSIEYFTDESVSLTKA